ncbi:MAG: 16S rRNA (uracil(1498)-N(3))-methyltransferase [Pseudomonadota bacterium]
MTDTHYKLPRLYIKQALTNDSFIELDRDQTHYLHTVMRKKNGDQIRVFNGQDGEWLCALENLTQKSGAINITELIKPQPETRPRIHLFFAPITKTRMDWMIEKAVELGVDEFHPVLTQNTEVRKIREERINSQLIEASEQCERLTLPILHSIVPLESALQSWDADKPFLACIERYDAKPIMNTVSDHDTAVLIGPVGGFTEDEKNWLSNQDKIIPVSLGAHVLRCETAALYAVSVLQAKKA